MRISRLSLLLMTTLPLTLASCEETGGHKARLERLEASMAELEQEVGTLQIRADELAEAFPDTLAVFDGAPGNCALDAHSFVRNHRGTDCETFEWELAASSRKCVAACDENARYAEAAAAGQAKCEELCAERRCPRGTFSPPERCATANCIPSSRDCPQECPEYDSCYLVIAQRPWNCRCLEL